MAAEPQAAEARAFVGLGANLGDPRHAIGAAIRAIAALPRTRLVALSSLYRSAPIDADGADYLNAVAEVSTSLAPAALLSALQSIEAAQGRERPYRNAPRTLDLDLLLYADRMLDTPRLRVPHPRMHARAFVLVPLAEIDGTLVIPGQQPLAELLRACAGQRIEKLVPAHALLEESVRDAPARQAAR